MVLKRKLPSRVQPEQAAPVVMPPAAPSTEAVALPDDHAPVMAPETDLSFSETPAPASVEEPAPAMPVVAEAAPEAPAAPEAETVSDEPAAPLEVSRPGENSMKRKVRTKRPREFATALPEAPAAAQPATPTAAPAVPQTDVEFDKVMDRLSKLGVMEESKDTLTASAAPMAAEALTDDTVPTVAAPLPEPSKGSGQPDWLAELTKELNAAMPKEGERDAKRDALGLPPPPTLPPNLLAGLVVDEGPGAASAQAALQPLPEPVLPPSLSASQSDVPWASPAPAKDEWNLGSTADKEASSLPPSPTQPGDIYAGVGKDSSAGMPPWQSGGHSQPAELPGSRVPFHPASMQGMSMTRVATTLAVLVLVVGGAWWLVSRGDKTQEQLARLTGSLRETTENLPANMGGAQGGLNGQGMVQPEQTIGMNNPSLLPPPDTSSPTNAVIDFADVPAEQANKPIVADGSEPMPEDIGFVASLQKAIAEKKAERMETTNGAEIPTTGNPALDKTIRNNALKAQLDAELAAYRKALVDAGNVAEAPRPGEFLASQQAAAKPYMNAAETVSTSAALMPPPATAKESMPAANAYASNPGNLPMLPEPSAEAPRVRTLADFDVNMMVPDDDEKIRIPKGIRPRLSTTDFPEMEVLSLVPGKGLIAYKNGTEGVLLIGESLDGWQLVQVGSDSAEFKNGGRSYYVNAE